MDQAGNIHFVDRLAEVPEEYRGQVINVEPTPMTQEQYRKALQEYRRKQSQAKKEAQRAEREAAKLERQRQRELKQAEKRASKQKREVQRVERPAKPTPAPKVTQVPARPVNQTITR
jgi:ATPase subunit of ABC transporter with duplicated ATPase domains